MTEIINPSIFDIGKQFINDSNHDNVKIFNYNDEPFPPEYTQNCQHHIYYKNMGDDGTKIEEFLNDKSNINHMENYHKTIFSNKRYRIEWKNDGSFYFIKSITFPKKDIDSYSELVIEGGGGVLFRLDFDLMSALGDYNKNTGTLNVDIINNLLYCSCKYNFIYLSRYHEICLKIKNNNNEINEIKIEEEIWYTNMTNISLSLSYKNYNVDHYKNEFYYNKPKCNIYGSKIHKIYFIENNEKNKIRYNNRIKDISGICLHGNLCSNHYDYKDVQIYYDKKYFMPILSYNRELIDNIYDIIFLFKNFFPNDIIRHILSFILKDRSGFYINTDKRNDANEDSKTFLSFGDCHIYFDKPFYGKIVTCELSVISYIQTICGKRYSSNDYRRIY